MKTKPEPVVSQLEYPVSLHLKLNAPLFVYLSTAGNLVEVTIRDDAHKQAIISVLRESFDLPD
jgi:hypothetical protein